MKKIGLITFHDTTNFGSFLQTFGLYKAINDMGYTCKVLDYKCEAINNTELPLKKPVSFTLRNIVKFILFEPIKRKKYIAFKNELNKMMNLSERYDKSSIKFANNEFDIFISGSDILWDLNLTKGDTSYFLDFVDSDKKKIAFSTSIGDKWDGKNLEIAKSLINNYDMIALREKESIGWLEQLTTKKVYSVCDPTMLLSKEYWNKYAKSSKMEKNNKTKKYILVYFPSEKIINEAKEFAKSNNLEVWVINYGLKLKGVKNIRPCFVADFLSLEKNASLILTSSYHGTLFAIYFNVPFYAYLRENSHNVRFNDLAKKLNIEDRIRDNGTSTKINLKMNYNLINEYVDEIRRESLQLLKENLE